MRIDTSSAWYAEKNNIPAFQNQSSAMTSQMTGFDKRIQSLYGSYDEITREDVLLYQYNRANPIKIFEPLENQKSKRVYNASDIPQEFIDSLNNAEITSWDRARMKCAIFCSPYDDINTSLDRLASGYAAVSEHLTAYFDGAELESYMEELNTAVSEIKFTMAEYYSKSVGGFLERNGGGEKETETIYNSILAEYDRRVEQYRDYIKSDSDYAHLKGTEDEWLLNDPAYMAQELRKACDTREQEASEAGYTMEEITLANRLIKEIDGRGIFDSLGNEESAGMYAGVMLLKANVFAENSAVSGQLAGKMTRSVRNYIDEVIERENARIRDMYDAPYYDKEKNPVYDVTEIYAVRDRLLLLYQSERDYSKAILEGIKYAQNKSKSKENKNGIVDRYKENYYWNQFYDNSSRFNSRHYLPAPGADRRTSFQKLAESWNQYTYSIAKSNVHQIKADNFSRRA